MPHLKKDFHRRNSFDNKYYNHSYINYLLNDKVKFQMNKYELYLDRFIVSTIDFVIQLNNAIARREKKEQNIEDIKKLYDTPIKNENYLYYGTKTIDEICVIGHSLAGVDRTYFNRIDNMTSGRLKWKVYYYREEEKERLKNNLMDAGVDSERIELVPSSEFYDL